MKRPPRPGVLHVAARELRWMRRDRVALFLTIGVPLIAFNRDYKTFAEFRKEIITFLRYEVPRNWRRFCDRITDNFRVIRRADFRVIA